MSVTVYPSGQASFGTLLQLGTSASPDSYVTVARVGDITGPQTSMTVNKTTSHSTGIPWDTYIPGIIDGGKISFPFFIKTDQPDDQGLFSMYKQRLLGNWRLIFPDAGQTMMYFDAFISGFKITSTVGGVTMGNIDMQVTGQIFLGEA